MTELEKDLQAACVELFELRGFTVSDLSQPRATMQTPGLPDLYLQHPRWRYRCWVEMKTPKRSLSPDQLRWAMNERDAGGAYWVVKSIEEAERLCDFLAGANYANTR